ncbi:unnamed protein product, partial [Phaeothamnion confervicola]
RFPVIGVAGGAGYVGSVLVPRLLEAGYKVRLLDLFLYGEEPLAAVRNHPNLTCIEGDVRNQTAVRQMLEGCSAVIHLACISNDPSVELDPDLSHTVNFESFGPFVKASKELGVRRFIFASSGSVYGVSETPDVTEEHPLVPVSLYNKYKAKCEPVLLQERTESFTPVIIRPATICGFSPRQRLDLTVNILTTHAYFNRKITVFGGSQMRPNLHMNDMIDLYLKMLDYPDELISGEIFNASYQNFSVAATAKIVQQLVSQRFPEWGELPIVTLPSDDIRSYHMSSVKLEKVLGFKPRYTVEDGANQLLDAFSAGKMPD